MTRQLAPFFPLALAIGLAAACGDDLDPTGSGADGGPSPGGDAGGDAGDPGDLAFAVATDFITPGVVTTVTVPGLEVTQNAVAGVASTDPVVRRHGDRIFIINRFGADNVTVLDADTLELIAQISTGPGSNPQDIAVSGDTVYVATLGGVGVAILDLGDPDAGVVDTIDLSSLDTADDAPNCHTLALRGNYLVVVCGILNDETFEPRRAGRVAVIDVTTGEVADVVPMMNERPFGFGLLLPEDSALAVDFLVPTAPDFVDPDAVGCVEGVTLDPAEGTAEVACVVQNEELGGFAAALAHDPERDAVWVAVTSRFDSEDFGPIGVVRGYDAATASLGDPVTPEEVRPIDVAVCPSGHVLVADATRGLRVYQQGLNEEVTSGPLDLGLPPVSNGLVCIGR